MQNILINLMDMIPLGNDMSKVQNITTGLHDIYVTISFLFSFAEK